jgi:hypothetical protein
MMLSSLIQHRTEARHFGRLSPGSAPLAPISNTGP